MFADLSYAVRILRKRPGFTALVVLMLALGIGANTAMFSILDAWLLQPLHFPDSDRLTIILKSEAKNPTEPKVFVGYRDWEAWSRESRLFSSLAGVFWRSFEARDSDQGVFGMIVTHNLFDTLSVKPALGRTFRPEDIDGPPVAIISHEFWQNRFHGARDILGRTLSLTLKNYQIVGVMPPGFGLRMIDQGTEAQIYALIQKGEPPYSSGGIGPIAAIGRLKPGISIPAAQQDLANIQRSQDNIHSDNPKGFTVLVTGLQNDNTRNVRASLWLASASLGFVLLIVCANVGSLLLGRTRQRQKEMAVRAALGSGRARIIRQLLTESAVIAAAGAACGVSVAYTGLRIFEATNPFGRMPQHTIALDWRALWFTLLAALASTIFFGLVPALEASRVDLNQAIKASARAVAGGHETFRLRGLLVSGQVALSLVLVIGAALMTQTLERLQSQPLGFRTAGVTVATVAIPKDRWNNPNDRRLVYDQLMRRLASTSGVESAAISNTPPLGAGFEDRFAIDGAPASSEDAAPKAALQTVTSGYFPALGIPVLSGRAFSEQDGPDSTPVAIVNRNAAERWFSGGKAIGGRVQLHGEKSWRTVVGVVGDTSYTFYNTLEWLTGPKIYAPAKQSANERLSPVASEVYLLIRGRAMTAATARELLKQVGSDLRLGRLQTLPEMVAEVVRQPRLRTRVLAAIAALSLALACIGIYGVMAQSVVQRTQEIGLRMALGAHARDLIRMVVAQGLRLALAGIAVGVAAALAITRVIASLLYGVKPTDIATFFAAGMVLLAAVVLAALIPARAAARVDPMVALRQD